MSAPILLMGAVILIGVIGHLLFHRTRVPESLFLIAAGLLIGPVLGLVDRSFFLENLGVLITFALVIVLLNAGLNLDLRKAMRTMRHAMLFTVLVFLFTVAIVMWAMHAFFGWPWLHGAFIGIITSGTTTVTITHLVERLKREATRDLLILESIINDVTVIAGASILVTLIAPGAITGQQVAQALFNEVVVSLLLGALVGCLLIFLYLEHLPREKLSYIFAIGVALLSYALAEYFGLNGAITVITEALVLGNYKLVLQLINTSIHPIDLQHSVISMKRTDTEFTFLIRSFFFVLLGIIFDLTVLQAGTVLLVAFTILACKFIARLFSSLSLGALISSLRGDHFLRTTIVANGFTSTLAAFLAVQAGIEIPSLAETVLLLVLLTTVTAIIGTAIHHHATRER